MVDTPDPPNAGAASSAAGAPSERLTEGDVARFRANRQAEIDSAALYRALSESETDARLASVFRRLSETESGHADFWARLLAPSCCSASSPPA
ncbi:MAG TPA: hypothetical protein VFW04_15585 [Gemmatimonadaceae bacterium]|nr:hypothetical protein [Gemmatimonadaceae bacterium]